MQAALFFLLVLLPLAALLGLVWWRFTGNGKGEPEVLVATSNHRSVRSFHYGPKPAPAPAEAAPPLSADNPISRLMPEEDFRAKEEQELQAEADRMEADQITARELAATESAVDAAAENEAAIPAEVPATEESEATPADAAPPVVSSVHALGTAAVSVFDRLGIDEPESPTTAGKEAAAVPATETATGAETAHSAPESAADDAVPESLYDNPITTAAPTKNDQANQLKQVELRQRKRAALAAKNASQKAALTGLYPGK
ncbi:hypothetical protein SAMN02745146_0196 [Hymenobacter daecheongensis DSM 21074]|uniref:Uncharacterized protein n=1 Tax=Hymenobacter daecheongensis DSM 21074 TaxID=1121955 RepID=A0A1M6M8A9_9BACT|nr:hypothetical protein [Hymenobacter daecheongensis]SHJ79696.1 hypothetical protein SAMN02745146_0196 [Hymenobacter daecheongensis DSM 21074]